MNECIVLENVDVFKIAFQDVCRGFNKPNLETVFCIKIAFYFPFIDLILSHRGQSIFACSNSDEKK